MARARVLPSVSVVPQRFIQIGGPPRKNWTRSAIELQIVDMLFDYSNIPAEKVTLEANLEKTLLLDRYDRFGFQYDLEDIFDFQLSSSKHFTRDLQSGREAVDWVSSRLEEQNRLEF
ncbi:hypothetical protein HDU97_009544 [Phlyctochytrium planicorne]|nr:hypothetical protein HDU97_009544 [Phlyctochytrium planicorne]